MIEKLDFETYLYISKNEFQIFVLDIKKSKNLYSEKLKIDYQFDFKNSNSLINFLDNNIYKIEKLVGNFIKNIILILNIEKTLKVNIGSKKKNYENLVKQKNLENNLIELKDLFKENYQNQKIMHMHVLNYFFDGKRYSFFEDKKINNHFCIEVSFVTIDNEITFLLNNILEKYQIKITKYMCGNYIRDFTDEDNDKISITAYELQNGLNKNEVIFVPKSHKNIGFFEKFFQLFN
jgi:hypothetical protein